MIDLVFAAPDLSKLTQSLRDDELEGAAMLLAVPVRTSTGWRLLVREVHVPTESAYDDRTPRSVRLSGSFCLPIEKKARLNNWSLIYCHTHPRENGLPTFSPIDDRSEVALGSYASSRSPNVPHLSLLFGRERTKARELGKNIAVRVLEVGEKVIFAYDPSAAQIIEEGHDRQIRAFGEEGQRLLGALNVGIVGAGGTGSVTIQQLAYLGINSFLIIDPEVVESTNLNRLVGAAASDVRKTAKVEVASRMIRALRPKATVNAVRGDVNQDHVARQLGNVDFIFCCTDSHASRHLVNQLAYQYRIPAIDIGIAIHRANDGQVQIAGRVTMLAPGLPCLWCAEQLDPNQVRQELMSEEQRKTDPYIVGFPGIVQPAVISLNSTMASLAVTMFLSAVVGIPAQGRYLIYDGNRSRVTSLSVGVNPECNFCSPLSSAGGGDAFPLPVRRNG